MVSATSAILIALTLCGAENDAQASARAALSKGEGEIFNIASGNPTSDYEIFAAIREALGFPGIEPKYAPKRPGEVDHIVLGIGKAASHLDWKPAVRLQEGIRRAAEWIRAKHDNG